MNPGLWVGACLLPLLAFAGEGYTWYRYRYLSQRAQILLGKGDVSGARAVLERVVGSREKDSSQPQCEARFFLAEAYLREDRPEQAAKHYRRVLEYYNRHNGPRPSQAYLHRRLAECLDLLGLADQASAERLSAQSALTVLQGENLQGHRLEARLLCRHGLPSEALKHYKEIEQTYLSDLSPDQRAALRLEWAETLLAAGLCQETLAQAARAHEESSHPLNLAGVDYVRGTALRSLARLDEAEAAFQRVQEQAAEGAASGFNTLGLCGLAGIAADRGDLQAANAFCAAALATPAAPAEAMAWTTLCNLAIFDGRFSEAARSARETANRLFPPSLVQEEERGRASLRLVEAVAHAYAGQGQQAQAAYQEGAELLLHDEKAGIACRALGAWIHALLALPEDTEGIVPDAIAAEAQSAVEAGKRGIAQDTFLLLGLAKWTRGEMAGAISYFEAVRATAPPPVHAATCWYHLGLCHAQAGNDATAQLAWSQASALGIDTHFARLARARLNE